MPDDPHEVTIAIHNGVVATLIVGVDYVFTWRNDDHHYDRQSRMGFLGLGGPDGMDLQWNGRGPERSTEDPYAGTVTIKRDAIRRYKEVRPDPQSRYAEKRA